MYDSIDLLLILGIKALSDAGEKGITLTNEICEEVIKKIKKSNVEINLEEDLSKVCIKLLEDVNDTIIEEK